MKILFVADPKERQDGWGVYACELSAALERRGHTVIRTPFLAPPAAYLANPVRSYRAARALTRLARSEKIDALHIVAEPYATLIPFLPRDLARKATITVHGTYAWYPQLIANPFKRYAAAAIMRSAYAGVGHVVCVSEYTKKRLEPYTGSQQIAVIPNGVTLAGTVPTYPHNPVPRFLFVGGVKLRKGVLEAIDAIAAYRDAYGDCHLRIIGSLADEPWYVERVRARIKELALDDAVELAGGVAPAELARSYAAADALIMLNVTDGKEFEGFGLVFLEANAYGCPALGASGTAAEDAVKEGGSGYLVTAGNAGDAASTLHRILSEGEALRNSARAWAEAHEWGVIAKRYLDVYTEPI